MNSSETPFTSQDMTNGQLRRSVGTDDRKAVRLTKLQKEIREYNILTGIICTEIMETHILKDQLQSLRTQLNHPGVTKEHVQYLINTIKDVKEKMAASEKKQKDTDFKIDVLLGKNMYKHRIRLNESHIMEIELKLKNVDLATTEMVSLGNKLTELLEQRNILLEEKKEGKLSVQSELGINPFEERTRWANATANEIKHLRNEIQK